MQRIPTKYNLHVPGFEAAKAKIKAQQTDHQILALVEALKGNPKIRWKDSIKKVLAKHEDRVGGLPIPNRSLVAPR
jgi:hypothetical protein